MSLRVCSLKGFSIIEPYAELFCKVRNMSTSKEILPFPSSSIVAPNSNNMLSGVEIGREKEEFETFSISGAAFVALKVNKPISFIPVKFFTLMFGICCLSKEEWGASV